MKHPAQEALGIAPKLRIGGHLPTPTVNGGGDSS